MTRIEYLYEKINILRKEQLINERYTGIQITGEGGAHVLWWLKSSASDVYTLKIQKKTAGTQLLIYIYIYIYI